MSKLCERPGCSEPGAAAYGMVPEDLLFWIAPLGDAPTADPNVLCRRHADAMVVPRGWTLDDRREAQPRLFKPRPAAPPATHVAPARRRRTHHGDAEQLVIDGTGEIPRPTLDADTDAGSDAESGRTDEPADGPTDASDAGGAELPATATDDTTDDGTDDSADEAAAAPWTPEFDAHDDLGGLLQVSSPLLARAFRGTERRRA